MTKRHAIAWSELKNRPSDTQQRAWSTHERVCAAETVFHPHAAALKGTHQRVLQLKIPPPGTQQRAWSMHQRGLSSSCSLCFNFMGLSDPQSAIICPQSASPTRSKAKRDAPACPAVDQPQNHMQQRVLSMLQRGIQHAAV